MAAAITPMPVVGGGTVDVSRPNDSGLHGLAQSLDVAVRSAAEIGQIAQANEFENVKNLLNDATVGPDEAKEIAGNAFFPLNRFAAQNRAGEAKVHAARNAIEDDLAAATDSIDARQRLRKHQQSLMEGENELGVQAGIRQAIADMAGPMINKASAQRLELRNRQRRNDESFILRQTLMDDPKAFTTSLKVILSDQYMDATQEPDVHETASQTLLNTLVENPDTVVSVKEAAQDVLASGAVVNALDRALYAGVLKAVGTIENATNNEAASNSERKRLLNFYGIKIDDHLRAHPGTAIPDVYAAGYLANSTDPVAARARIRTATEASKGASIGILGTDAHVNGKKTLDRLFSTGSAWSEAGMSPADRATKAAAYELYDQITGAIDPDVNINPAEAAAQAQQAAQVAHDRAKAFAEAQVTAADGRKARQEELETEAVAAVGRGDAVAVRKIQAQLDALDTESMLQVRKGLIRGVIDYAAQTGIDIDRDLRP